MHKFGCINWVGFDGEQRGCWDMPALFFLFGVVPRLLRSPACLCPYGYARTEPPYGGMGTVWWVGGEALALGGAGELALVVIFAVVGCIYFAEGRAADV